MSNAKHSDPAQQLAALQTDLTLLTEELIARQDELVALFTLTEALRGCLDGAAVLDIALAELLGLLRADGAFATRAGQVQTAGVVSAEADALLQLHNHIIDSGADVMWSGEQVPSGLRARSCVAVPVHDDETLVAVIGVVNGTGRAFDYPDRKLLRVIATQVGQHMEVARLHEEAVSQARMQAELALAREVQTNLLPKQVPSVASVDIAGTAQPAFEVGGDFYDFVPQNGDLVFTVGDVAGKGMSAAIVMSMVRTTLRNAAGFAMGLTPAMMLSYVNAGLYNDFTEIGSFATAFLGRYSPQTGVLRYANAGHAPVIYCPRHGQARLLQADGTALGVLPDSFAEDQQLTLNPGDLFVVASDGLNEASDATGAMFGYDRLLALVARCSARDEDSAETIMHAILDAVHQFSVKDRRDDDQTIVVLKGTGR